ncbi:hypothetical protein SLS57_001597 [Botryosphaeria dothidea]
MASTKDLRIERLFSVKDFICVVTGGGSGIGLMAAQALAANVCAAGISGTKAEPSEEHAQSLKDKLWNNETFEVWNDVYNADVTSVYFTTVAFLPLLQAGTDSHGHLSASVIVISSMSGIMRHAQGHFSYNAAKGGTVHLTKLMSAEFQKVRVRVNSIAPGYFPSEMTAKESGPDQKSHLPAENVQAKGHVPAQRAGSDEEMAQAVVSFHICQMTSPTADGHDWFGGGGQLIVNHPNWVNVQRQWEICAGHWLPEADPIAVFAIERSANETLLQLFLTKNAYVNGEILAVDGGVLNVVSGR